MSTSTSNHTTHTTSNDTPSDHHHHHHHQLAQRNAAHFDAIAHEHVQHHDVKRIASTIAEKIVALLDKKADDGHDGHDDDDNDNNSDDGSDQGISVLDYACGGGAMTWALFDKLNGNWKRFVGVDISPKSVELYNQTAATQFTPEEMHAICADLTAQPDQLAGQSFDAIVCSQAYHHFADVNTVTRILASFLNPGGKLFIADHMAHDGTLFKSEHGHGHGHGHEHEHEPHHGHGHGHEHEHGPTFAAAAETVSHRRGFAQEDMKFILEQAGGLHDFQWLPNLAAVRNKSIGIFLAVGTRPQSAST